jgi:hypothetical protein
MRATSGSTSSRMSASVMMLPVALRDADLDAVAHHLHELTEDDLGLAGGPKPSASIPACSDFTCPWWSAPQMSMRW